MDEKSVVSIVPSIDDVAVPRADGVQEVPVGVEAADRVVIRDGEIFIRVPSEVPVKSAKRQPVDHQTHRLNWQFIILMGKIAHYAAEKYGSVEQYTDSRLEGEKSPINHIIGHIADYCARKPHDKFGDLKMQLAAIAYNAMMEFWYLEHGGPTVPEGLYKEPK